MRKFVLSVTAILLLLTLTLGGAAAYIASGLDFSADEALFRAALGERGTVYYAYDESGAACEVYRTSSARRSEWFSLEAVGENLVNGFLSAEDREFFKHGGVNYKRTLAALFNHIFKARAEFGGSTITQQVIKNISGDNQHTLKRKAEEIIRAKRLEREHSKEEILELYLNIVPMGNNIYGVGRASEVYFGKSPAELSLAEAATLVGITNAPARFDPYRHPEECVAKRNRVLYAMLDNGKISEEEREIAREEELRVLNKRSEGSNISSWFIETVEADILRDLSQEYGISESAARIILDGGTEVYTTMNREVQGILEKYFGNTDLISPATGAGHNMAMAVCDANSGALVGIVGALGEKRAEKILNLALSPRVPGSALKPLALYAPLLDSGEINPASRVLDEPLYLTRGDGEERPYPRNSPDVYDGEMTVRDALRLSKNTVACRLYDSLGGERIYKILSDGYGISSLDAKADKGMAALALGQLSRGVSIRRLTECYTAFTRDGTVGRGQSYHKLLSSTGEELLRYRTEDRAVLKSETAHLMTDLLSSVVEDGTARAVTLKSIVDTAGKTGTSSGSRDKTFVGYTPYFTAGIWCGSEGGSGSAVNNSLHLMLWDRIMVEIHERLLSRLDDGELRSFSTEGLLLRAYETPDGELEYGYFSPVSLPD
ncbi:MAG: transglycosylase domain-containing protein [Clostridia bacterium]|nr:transglycosylase domain-containing protein [Clostridia bacterium]